MHKLYTENISKRISDLLLAVIALGILVVSVEYVQFAFDNPEQLNTEEFWQRVVLMLLVVAFTAYNFLAYAAYWAASKKDAANTEQEDQLTALRVIAMYLLDLLHVTITAWMYAVLLIGNLTSASNRSDINVDSRVFLFLFVFAALWHLVVLFWYVARRGTSRNKKLHTKFLVSYLIVIVVLYFAYKYVDQQNIIDWVAIVYYGGMVFAIYKVQAVPYLRLSLER